MQRVQHQPRPSRLPGADAAAVRRSLLHRDLQL